MAMIRFSTVRVRKKLTMAVDKATVLLASG